MPTVVTVPMPTVVTVPMPTVVTGGGAHQVVPVLALVGVSTGRCMSAISSERCEAQGRCRPCPAGNR
jgi:hypothetical protein